MLSIVGDHRVTGHGSRTTSGKEVTSGRTMQTSMHMGAVTRTKTRRRELGSNKLRDRDFRSQRK